MTLARWRPMSSLLSQWPDFWDEDWMPMVSGGQSNLDVYETENEVVVRANVAGVREEDIDLTFEKGVLLIKADRVEEDKKDKKHYSKSSWNYSYKVAVPGMIDHGVEPKAEIDDGMVTVTFKKSEGAKPRKLTVRKKQKADNK